MNNFQLKLANKNKNNKVKPILPSSYQKKAYCYWENKDNFEEGGGGFKVLNNYSNIFYFV